MGSNMSTTTSSCSQTTPAKLPEYFRGSYGTMYYTRDMKKAINFYTQKVGLTPQYSDDCWAQFDLNGHALCLHAAGDEPIRQGGGCLIIQVTDIQKVVGRLKENRVEFVKDVTPIEGCGICADFKDLDGNVVSLYQENPQGSCQA